MGGEFQIVLFFLRTSWNIASCRWVLGSIKDLWVPILILIKKKFNKFFGGELDENIFQNILIVAGFELWTWHKGRHWAGRQAGKQGVHSTRRAERHEHMKRLLVLSHSLLDLFVCLSRESCCFCRLLLVRRRRRLLTSWALLAPVLFLFSLVGNITRLLLLHFFFMCAVFFSFCCQVVVAVLLLYLQ